MNFMQTDDPRYQPQVDMMNTLFRKWDHIILEAHRSMNYDSFHDKKLVLYIDQETYYDFQELMHTNGSCGPLTISTTCTQLAMDTTLFGHELTIYVVMNHGRHDHLCFI
jgi:hypothetical protein